MIHRLEIEMDCSPDCAADLLTFFTQRLEDDDGRLLSFVSTHPEPALPSGEQGNGAT